jgi:hypothetical protein
MTAPTLSRFTDASGGAGVGVDPVHCRPARDAAEIAAHHHIRHAVFVEEQSLFAGTDAHDARTHTGARARAARRTPGRPDVHRADRSLPLARLLYSTVTLFARLRGLSTSRSSTTAAW